ncbi:hypothetical protein C427_3610 [Paraglaciecola psychrophila 170]|uniref:Uncharacterized protein n=1 Tax=Paraglaciecola psychrophila 170 TaxID=1129794 RepID=K6YZP8_9ALTE|nr:hypothetical protein C427_3610 [Paraglaciecola psychrophila 170]GAC38239.1 hypothetical protein GPSY_2626 [Paraglaciecola psychrophila 170]
MQRLHANFNGSLYKYASRAKRAAGIDKQSDFAADLQCN